MDDVIVHVHCQRSTQSFLVTQVCQTCLTIDITGDRVSTILLTCAVTAIWTPSQLIVHVLVQLHFIVVIAMGSEGEGMSNRSTLSSFVYEKKTVFCQ